MSITLYLFTLADDRSIFDVESTKCARKEECKPSQECAGGKCRLQNDYYD